MGYKVMTTTENKASRNRRTDFGPRAKAVLLGNSWRKGVVNSIIIYALLVIFGFIFLLPILNMISYSLMSQADVVDPFVNFIPTSFYLENFVVSLQVLDYFKALFNSLLLSIVPSIAQCVACAIIGYGLGRFNFPAKKLLLAMILVTFIIPPQVTMIPQMRVYTTLGINNIFAFIIPAIFGQGLKSAIFILVFYQYFRSIPNALIEAARIDGANSIKTFVKIACPLASAAFILTFLFSFVWYFNETTLTAVFLSQDFVTLPLQLARFERSYMELYSNVADAGRNLSEAIYMAGTLLAILPLLLIYFVMQRYFVESIDKVGITGE